MSDLTSNRIPLRVRDIRWEADGVLSVGLEGVAGEPLPSWTPGAHIDIELSNQIERQYSLCSDPEDSRSWRVAVLREEHSGGFSSYVHETLRPGEIVSASPPKNHFRAVPNKQAIFVAAGIGITPILAHIRAVKATGIEPRIAYLGRARNRMAFLDHGELAAATVIARDERERLNLQEWLGEIDGDTVVYACGPTRLLDQLEVLATEWPPDALQIERFQAKELTEPLSTESFQVECRRSGISVEVPSGISILEVLEGRGVQLPSSCREGVCGTCEVPLLEGEAEHRDSLLSQSEKDAQDTMMVCVSRAKTSRLVIDI